MRKLIPLLALLTLMLPLYAQTPPRTYDPNTVMVTAQGKFEAEPDTADLGLTLSARDSSQEAAYKRVSAAADQFRAILRQNNVDPKQARVAQYNVQPIIDYQSNKQRIIAYLVQTSVELKTRDFSLAGKLLPQLAALPDSSNQSLSYSLEDVSAAKQRAIEDAYKNAHDAAGAIARASGRQISNMIYASVDAHYEIAPRPMMAMRSMAGAAEKAAPTEEFSQQKSTVTAQVVAVFQLQ